MRLSILRILLLLQALPICALASNSVVNMSHYDMMRPAFGLMKDEGIVGVIHEATYPRFNTDSKYAGRQETATRAGLRWGAYHFADATNPVRQADHFLRVVEAAWQRASPRPREILLVLDFEKNGHYPGGTMRVDQAVAFVERIRERTGKYPGLYSNDYRIRSVLNSSRVSSAHKRVLTRCWLWIANYTFVPTTTAPWRHWQMWQYTGDGKCRLRPRSAYPIRISNILKAERNMFRGSRGEAEAFWIAHAWNPAE